MDPVLFGWSILASLVASVLIAGAPVLARWLVRLRARFLMPGPEAERLLEEWLSVLLELGTRGQQLRFALLLFKKFKVLQIEIEHRAAQTETVDALLEARFLQVSAALELDSKKKLQDQASELERRKQAELETARAQLMKDRAAEFKARAEAKYKERISKLEHRINVLEVELKVSRDNEVHGDDARIANLEAAIQRLLRKR
jgi:hypothetical protein